MSTPPREVAVQAGIVLLLVGGFGAGIALGITFPQPQPQQQALVLIVHGAPEGVTCVPTEACRVMSWAEATGTLGAGAPR